MKKNIQVIDGAINSVYKIYEVEEEVFDTIFQRGTDVAFLDDLVHLIDDNRFWSRVYKNKVDKKNVTGIHGTLHLTGSYVEKEYFPNRKETDI
ncbi:hypothetical protein D3C77_596010 [compost metagenome]